jgi:putative FmdB family regulatory protein
MPIYAFQCQACGHHFDRLQKLSDADPTDCPACAQAAVTRKLTAPSFRLAGGGWYETDFKKDGKRNLAEKGEGSRPAETAPAKAESAPATPAPAPTKAAE